jgi:uncharacterized protein (DUF1499 family)
MVRRRIVVKEPPSRLAIWARRCAVFSLAATVLVIVFVRAGWIETAPSLGAMSGALAMAGLAILLAFAALVVIWRDGVPGVGASLTAIFIGAGLLAYPAYLGTRYLRTPPINDVSTDLQDPPRFEQAARFRPRGTADYPGGQAAELQRAAYPDLETLQVAANVQLAFEAARSVLAKRRWTIILDRPPTGRRDGQLEAIARTPVLGFREDVAVRIRSAPDGANIDVRSASRYGRHDLGSNATRVRSLLEDIDDAVTALLEARQRQQQKSAPAKAPPQPTKR